MAGGDRGTAGRAASGRAGRGRSLSFALVDAELERVRQAVAKVPGWLSRKEAETLYTLAKRCSGRGAIVEIGSWRGRSTICLALGSKAGAGVRVFSIDRHTEGTFGDFTRNLETAGVADLVTPIRSRSLDAVETFSEPIELLFVDASHVYDEVRADFERWVPKLVDGGVLALHDTTFFDGPKRVAEELVFRSRRFKDVRFVVSSTTVGTKVAENALADRLRNRLALAGKLAFELGARTRRYLPRPVVQAARKALGAR